MLQNPIKFLWIAILTMPLFFSCSSHYLATMQSSNMGKNKVDSTFYSGNDTLGISYAFNNIDGSVRVRFENYTEKSMIIDLTKSALIVNGKSQAFIDGTSFVQGRLGAQASTIDWSNDGTFTESTVRGGYSGTIYKDENVIFIPAKSYTEGSYSGLHQDIMQIFKNDFRGTRGQVYIDYDYAGAVIAEYNAANSPLKIRSHVSYALLDAQNKPLNYGVNVQNFYSTNFTRIRGIGSKRVRRMLDTRADISGLSEVNQSGAIVGTVLVLGGLGVAAALVNPGEAQ